VSLREDLRADTVGVADVKPAKARGLPWTWDDEDRYEFEEGRVRAIARGLIRALRIQENQP
jgi:hypothetical protein